MKFLLPILLLLIAAQDAFAQLPPHRGERVDLVVPDGFKITESKQGGFDAASGDVLFAVAQNEAKHTIRCYHASNVPLKQEEVPRFLDFMKATFSRNPGVRVLKSELRTANARSWGTIDLEVLDDRTDNLLLIAFFSVDGSPSRFEFGGPLSDIDKLRSARDQLIERTKATETAQKPNQAMQRTAGRSAFPLPMTSTFDLQPHAPSPAVADLVSR